MWYVPSFIFTIPKYVSRSTYLSRAISSKGNRVPIVTEEQTSRALFFANSRKQKWLVCIVYVGEASARQGRACADFGRWPAAAPRALLPPPTRATSSACVREYYYARCQCNARFESSYFILIYFWYLRSLCKCTGTQSR